MPSHRAPKLKAARKHARTLTLCAATLTATAAPAVASAASSNGPGQPVAQPATGSETRSATAANVSYALSTASSHATAVSNTTSTGSYTVARGDTLFAIASRTLGSGDKYWTIFNLNKNRAEAGGEHFTDPNLIRTGWTLTVPGASSATASTTTSDSTSSSASTATATSGYSNNLDGWIKQAISILNAHGYVVSYNAIYETAMHESAGNPSAVNHTDSNAMRGTPSTGLMQMIQPTFNAYALSGYGNIYNPVDNIIAGVIYAHVRYGGLDNVVAARCGGSCWFGY
ncbi:MAG TPA: transglycosylase SLT domain-containing protein [Actinocrinis sp.]|nr:transglycosylase SLT domain-containing protein [Actinocrinis sp.]